MTRLDYIKGITQYSKIVERTDYLAQVFNQATKALLAANSGPVLLSFPYTIQKELVDDTLLDGINFTSKRAKLSHQSLPIDNLKQLINEAQRPVIIAGFGCIKSDAQTQVSLLSESLGIPVTTTLKGKGTIRDGAELSLGCLGVTSNGDAYQYIVEHADLLIF